MARNLIAAGGDVTDAIRTKRVILHRPQENKDKGLELGFNGQRTYFEFGKPTDAPADLVDYFRAQMRSEISADEKGMPVVSQMPFLMIQDVPLGIAA